MLVILLRYFYLKEDHCSFIRNLCSCEKKAKKNSGLHGIRTLDLCDTGAVLYQLIFLQIILHSAVHI